MPTPICSGAQCRNESYCINMFDVSGGQARALDLKVQLHSSVAGYINAICNLRNVTSHMFVDFQVVIFVNGCEILTQLFFYQFTLSYKTNAALFCGSFRGVLFCCSRYASETLITF